MHTPQEPPLPPRQPQSVQATPPATLQVSKLVTQQHLESINRSIKRTYHVDPPPPPTHHPHKRTGSEAKSLIEAEKKNSGSTSKDEYETRDHDVGFSFRGISTCSKDGNVCLHPPVPGIHFEQVALFDDSNDQGRTSWSLVPFGLCT